MTNLTIEYERDTLKLLRITADKILNDDHGHTYYFVDKETYFALHYWEKFTVAARMDYPDFRDLFASKALWHVRHSHNDMTDDVYVMLKMKE